MIALYFSLRAETILSVAVIFASAGYTFIIAIADDIDVANTYLYIFSHFPPFPAVFFGWTHKYD